jgi:DNA-binding NarL/FixJ family response regulator
MQFLHSKKEMNQLNKQGFNFERSISDQKSGSLDNFVLTKRRRQVAKLLLEGKNFYEIGDELNIAKGTVTKHASDVYKDTNCVDIDDFLMKFGGEIK